MGTFLLIIIAALIKLVIFVLVVNAIFSWLIAFDVVNMRNRVVYQVTRLLDALTRPILRPVQRVIPPFGGVDITPIIVIIVLSAFEVTLLPMIFAPIQRILG
jgi:YggT family protein